MHVTHLLNHLEYEAVVYDVGPADQFGEITPALAKCIGVNPSARSGGESRRVVRYEIFPGVPALVDGIPYPLQRSRL